MRRQGATPVEVVSNMLGKTLNGPADPASRHARSKPDAAVRCEVGFADCP